MELSTLRAIHAECLVLDFADNLNSRIIGPGLATDAEVEQLKDGLRTHLSDPAASVFIGPYVQVWGRKAT